MRSSKPRLFYILGASRLDFLEPGSANLCWFWYVAGGLWSWHQVEVDFFARLRTRDKSSVRRKRRGRSMNPSLLNPQNSLKNGFDPPNYEVISHFYG